MAKVFDFDTATRFVSGLPHEVRMSIARLLLHELVEEKRAEHPLVEEAVDARADELREGIYRCIREASAEGMVGELALIAAWFVEQSDKPILTRWLWYIEHYGGGEEKKPTLTLTTNQVATIHTLKPTTSPPVVDNPGDERLREEHALMRRSLEAIRSAVHDDDEEGGYAEVRKVLDELDAFHDDLSGQKRVVRELCIDNLVIILAFAVILLSIFIVLAALGGEQ